MVRRVAVRDGLQRGPACRNGAGECVVAEVDGQVATINVGRRVLAPCAGQRPSQLVTSQLQTEYESQRALIAPAWNNATI